MKLILPRHTLLSFLFILFSFAAYAQDMEVTDAVTAPYTPENLITNVFLGDGVEVTSFQYDGDAEAIGFFKSAEDEIGIERGIVMTTGKAMASNTHPGATGVGTDFAGGAASPNITVDADLSQLDPANVNNDISRYIISFIPTSDTVRFNYVFASEEYPEYSCSTFNDVFGFFISGPGISGPFSNNAENIALIPNSTTYVSINNLHPDDTCPAVNEEYYNPNGGGNQPTYDGYTDVFTAEAIVVPCEEYTIKLVIADKGDTAFDSGVFLQAKSFGSPSLDIDIVTASLDGAVVEGCSDGVITIALPNPVETDLPLDYEIFGVAENGVDFEFIPEGLFIPAGESEINVPLIAFEDGLDEGSETFAIAFQTNFCDRDTFYLSIKDNELVDPELGPDITQCASETVTLDGTVDVPLPPVPTFTNETDFLITPVGVAVSSSVTVTGVQPLILGPGVIRAVCMNIDHNWDDDIDVFLQSPGGQFIEMTTDNGGNGNDYIETCFTEGASTPINFPGPFAPNTATPFTGDWLPEGTWGDLYDSEYPTNGEWQLLVIDDSNGFTGSLLDWTITFEPSYQVYYEWTPSEGLSCDDCPMPDASPDVSTMYTLRAYDTYGCEVFDSIFIDVIPALDAPTVVCSGGTLECVTFSWNDIGLPAYEVNVDGTGWVPANGADGLSHEICGLGAEQIVNIEVQGIGPDCNGFIGLGECQTPECEVPQVVMQNATNVSCQGGNDGTLTIEMTGNFPPFTYEIDGQTEANVVTANFTGLTPAVHDLIVTDASGCELTLQVAIGEPDGMSLEDVLIQNIQCNGADDGSAAVIVTDGQYPLSFEWSSGETDSVAVALEPGAAFVTVTDVQGCEIIGNIFIEEPDEMTVALDTEIISCNGENTGEITSMVEGGEGDYTYDWVGTGQTTPSATGLIAGDYTLVVTDENMCSVTELITVDENEAIVTDVTGTEATCSGTGDGTALATASGGAIQGFFFYEWDDNVGASDMETASGLDVGWYYVTISDLAGCAAVDSIEITAPNAMDVDFTEITTSCFDTTDGASSITVAGGTMPYTYVWSDGGDETSDRNDLAEGMQTMTVTDANDCFVEVELNIPAPDELILTIVENNAAACNGTATGSVICGGTGGTGDFANYTFNWSNGQTTATASNLLPGNYCVTVSDENGCEATTCVDVAEPEELAVTELIENVSCFSGADGQITVTPTGGTEPYAYQWTDGQTTQTATALPQGMIQVIITDANDCTITAEYMVEEPTELTANTDFTALSCDGTPDGTATVTGIGGTEPYTYLWDDGTAQTTQTAINLDATLYNVTVMDAEGCEAISNVTLTEPVQVVIDGIDPTNVTCFGGEDGAATVVYSGGTAPFDIEWSNTETGETVTTLVAGTYTVNITDQSGCTASESIVIEQPEDLNITLSQEASFCHNGTDGTASVTELSYGNNPPADLATFTYEWSNGQDVADATSLTGGQTYEVLITDAVGCQWTQSIEIGNPAAIGAVVDNIRNVSCFEGNDGLATVAGGGGNIPYSYQWPATAGNQMTGTVDNLIEGSYIVTVADANGCETSVELRIEQPERLGLNFETENASCFGVADGKATALANGGVEPYVLNWSSGVTGEVQTDLFSDFYIVTVVDGNNCSYFDTLLVQQPEPVITEVIEAAAVSCYDYRDGYIDLESNGGTAPYTYSLDGENFFGTSRLIGLSAGLYDVTIKDGNGCEFEISDVEITEPDELIVDLGEDLRIEYGDFVQIFPDIVGSAGGEIYDWNSIGPIELLCYDCPSMRVDTAFAGQAAFELTLTDREGCVASDIITIFVNKEVNVQVPTGFSPNGDGQNDLLHVHGDSDIQVNVFRVFDRWGELVYESGGFMLNDMSIGWDGNFRSQKMPSGVYVWYVEVIAEDGEPATFKGNTTILR